VKAGDSDQQLSPEERQAITFALRSDAERPPVMSPGHAAVGAPDAEN
jgi:hypothetical protein